jgi:site-specific DNA-methyltransferase (adenine-specific)
MIQLVPLHAIQIPQNRQRREFDEIRITELSESIASRKGLMHAIVLRDDGLTLVAGERRLRAIKRLVDHKRPFHHNGTPIPVGMVPYTKLSQLSPLELMEAEYEEIVQRTDYTHLEKAKALSELHNLRSLQAEARGQTQTLQATATEVLGRPALGGHITEVRNALLINSYSADPEVAASKSAKEAFNIVKRKLTDKFTAALAKNVAAEKQSTPHVALHGDMETISGSLDPDQFDVIITDPPYGIEADKFSATDSGESGVRHEYKDDKELAHKVMRSIIMHGSVVAKQDAAMYLFCDFTDFDWLRGLVNQAGWTAWDRPIIWHKPSGGMMGNTQHGPRRSYETIMFAYRGNKRTTGVYLDVIVHQPSGLTRGHSAEKPVPVYHNLLRRSTVPGMRVVDFCSGTGPIFPAANQLSLRATGIELSEKYYNVGLTRIADKE